MGWSILADVVLVLHGMFIVWAALGALAVWRGPRLLWWHLPALTWGVWIEASAGICPLTPLEMALRRSRPSCVISSLPSWQTSSSTRRSAICCPSLAGVAPRGQV